MKRSQRCRAVCALACAGLTSSVAARAEEPLQAEPTRFEFRAPAGCSSADDFAARVRRRSARIRLVTDSAATRSLVVEIQEPGPNGVLRGTVTVVAPDGAVRARQLKAASCEEAVDGLSLIATVTLDPDALLGEPAPPEPVTKPPAPPPVTKPVPPPPAHGEPTPTQKSYRVSVGLAAALLVRTAPEPALGGSVSTALELNPGGSVAPFFRLLVTHAERRGLPESIGRANFAFTLPTLDACPLRFGPRQLGVRPCAFASVGLLEVWGSEALHNQTHARTYAAAGGALWLGWRVSEVVEIIADGRVGAPFARDRFAFDGVPFFTTLTPTFSAGLGAAGGFP